MMIPLYNSYLINTEFIPTLIKTQNKNINQ